MGNRPRMFDALRRRKRAIGRVLLPLLAAVWFTSGASLCFGMSAESVREAPAAHDHDHANHAAHHAPAHESASHEHGSCPHCPNAVADAGIPASHVSCAALDDLADAGAAAKAVKSELPHALTAARIDVAASAPSHAFVRRPTPLAEPHSSTVPLNVRHCVFLI